MSIAVLGWGSLVWSPGTLQIKTAWRSDGPRLPIEFARISQDKRLTLVINDGASELPVYWALSERTALNEARENLRLRENSKARDIHYLNRDGSAADNAPAHILSSVGKWLSQQHDELIATLWTGLPANWKEERGADFTVGAAVQYLVELEASQKDQPTAYARAREYLVNAPPTIDTAVRKAMRARGWVDADLPANLFEA
jgi:hypothetical protein